MLKKLVLTMALLTVLSAAAAAEHGPGQMGPGPMGEGLGPEPSLVFPAIIRNLGLSADQQDKVRTILQSHRGKLGTLFPQLREAQESIAAKLLADGTTKVSDVAPEIEQVTALRKQLIEDGITVALEVRAVLTPAQVVKARQLQERMKALHDEMKKLLGEPEPPPDV